MFDRLIRLPIAYKGRHEMLSFCVYCICAPRLTAGALSNQHDVFREGAHWSSRRRRERHNRRARCDLPSLVNGHLQAPLVQEMERPDRRFGRFRGSRTSTSARERTESAVQHGLAADAPAVVQRQSHHQQSGRDLDGTIALWPWLRRLRFVCNLWSDVGSTLHSVYGYLGRSERQ
jgi:hypothetical protein